MNPTRGETDPSRNPVPSEHHGGDGAATGGHDSPVLTPVEDLVEQFGPPSVSLEDMLQVALDPSTPDPGDELIPDNDSVHDSASDAGADADGASGEPDLSDLGDGSYPDATPGAADDLPSPTGESEAVGGEHWDTNQPNPQGHDDYGVPGEDHGYGGYDGAHDPNHGTGGHNTHPNAHETDPFNDEGGIG